MRHNLFHGGKHGSTYWNDADRMRLWLETTIAVLDDLADQVGLTSDYRSEYGDWHMADGDRKTLLMTVVRDVVPHPARTWTAGACLGQ